MYNTGGTDIPYGSDIYIGSVIKNNRRYIYLRGNFVLEHLNNLSPANQNQLIHEIFSKESTKLLELKSNIFCFERFQKESITELHDLSIRIHDSQICWIKLPWREETIFELYQEEYDEKLDEQDSLILNKMGDTYIIEDYTHGIKKLLGKKQSIGTKINNVLFHQVFDLCLKQNMPVFYYFTPPQMKQRIMKVIMFPFSSTIKKRIFIYFRYKNGQEDSLKKLLHRTERKEQLFAKMTLREQEVAEKVLNGSRNKEISSELFISEGTVKRTVYNIYQKLGVTTRVEFVRLFMIDGIL